MVLTRLLPVWANLAIVYIGLGAGSALLLTKSHKYTGMTLLTCLGAVINYRYGTSDVGETLAFFNAVYDPFYNVGVGADIEAYPGLMRCNGDSNNCSALGSTYEFHAVWAATFYTRFTSGIEATARCAKLYAHVWMNTTAFIICLVQFHEPTRKKYLELHRKLGWLAITLVTCGTASALWLASDHGSEDTYGGYAVVAGWISMAGTNLGCLFPGVLAVLRKDIPAHKKWMTRFYGGMWGSFLVFRLLFLLGGLFRWHKTAMIMIAVWSSAPLGVAAAEWARLQPASGAQKTA